MKLLSKIVVVLTVLVMVLGLIPAMQSPAQAAATPILVLSSTTAVNPILSHHLDFETYSTGGPFTVTFEWKGSLKPNDPSDVQGCHGLVNVTGTIYGGSTEQKNAGFAGYNPPSLPSGDTEWSEHTFQFQNVGTYPMTGTVKPGNILRFGLWKAKGSMYIKNVVIKNAAGDVLYNLNTDAVVAQAVAQTQATGMTECDMSELAAIDYEHCPWVAGQFSSGKYTSSLTFESNGGPVTPNPTTTTLTKPPVSSTTKTPESSSSSSVTTQSTTAPTQSTTEPTSVGDEPCFGNHTFENGFCVNCGAADPNYVPPVTVPTTEPTTVPTTVPTSSATQPTVSSTGNGQNPANDGDSGLNPVVWILIVAVVAAGIGIAIFCFVKAKKQK